MGISSGPVLSLHTVLWTGDPRWPSTATAAIAADSVYLIRLPRVSVTRSLTAIDVFVGTAAGNVAAALMTTSDAIATAAQAIAATFARVAVASEVAAAGSNVWQSLSLTGPYLYNPGTDLWVAVGGNNGSLTILRSVPTSVAVSGDALLLQKASAYSSGIPTSIASAAGVSFLPIIKVR